MKILAIDIGGTFIKYCIFDQGDLLEDGKARSEAINGADILVRNVDNIIEHVLNKYHIDAIAISTAGVVDVEKGQIIHAGPTIPGYKGFNWKQHIRDKYAMECQVENDVNCAALGEYSIGCAKGKDKVLVLAIGTGIGGAFISNGSIFRGNNGCAMEVGYMSLDGSEFENIASTTALVNYHKSIAKLDKSNGFLIFQLAKEKDEKAIEAIDYTMDKLCKGIANISYILDPQSIVLGGGIMEQGEYLRPIIEEKLKKYMLPIAYEKLDLSFASAGNLAASYGALYHFNSMRGK